MGAMLTANELIISQYQTIGQDEFTISDPQMEIYRESFQSDHTLSSQGRKNAEVSAEFPGVGRGDVHRVLPQLVAGLGHLLHDVVRWLIRNHWANQNRAATGHGDHVSVAMVRNLGDLQEEIERDGERRPEWEVGLNLEENIARACKLQRFERLTFRSSGSYSEWL